MYQHVYNVLYVNVCVCVCVCVCAKGARVWIRVRACMQFCMPNIQSRMHECNETKLHRAGVEAVWVHGEHAQATRMCMATQHTRIKYTQVSSCMSAQVIHMHAHA
jgi:hypothetical protein